MRRGGYTITVTPVKSFDRKSEPPIPTNPLFPYLKWPIPLASGRMSYDPLQVC